MIGTPPERIEQPVAGQAASSNSSSSVWSPEYFCDLIRRKMAEKDANPQVGPAHEASSEAPDITDWSEKAE